MLKEKKIGDIVLKNTLAADVFDKYGLDYCCHGNIKLADACSIKFIDISKVIRDLKEIGSGESLENIAEGKLTTLIDYISSKHHKYVRQMAPMIVREFVECLNIYGSQYPNIISAQRTFTKIKSDLQTHTLNEENKLFPTIKTLIDYSENKKPIGDLPFGTILDLVEILQYEHEVAGNEMMKIYETMTYLNPPEDAPSKIIHLYEILVDFKRDLNYHVLLENFVLFRRAKDLENDIAISMGA